MTITHDTVSPAESLMGLSQRIVQAWADHDGSAFAQVFTEDGIMTLPGVHQQGREAIAAFMSQAFQGPYRGTQVTGQPICFRSLSPEVALMVTEGGVIPAGSDEVPQQSAVRASWLAVLQEGTWRLAAYHNSPK